MSGHTIVWRRLDEPGYEAARLFQDGAPWRLNGSSIQIHEDVPCRLEYTVTCDLNWRTISASVVGWIGDRTVNFVISSEPENPWRLNGVDCPQVAGCIDVDLNFSPSTNLLPIRRLNLAVGERAEVTAAWLRFPSFELEPLQQIYHRLSETTYRYASAGGKFTANIEVNEVGLVTRYGDYWQAEAIG